MSSKTEMDCAEIRIEVDVKALLYVHRNRRFIRDGSPGRPPRLSHSSSHTNFLFIIFCPGKWEDVYLPEQESADNPRQLVAGLVKLASRQCSV